MDGREDRGSDQQSKSANLPTWLTLFPFLPCTRMQRHLHRSLSLEGVPFPSSLTSKEKEEERLRASAAKVVKVICKCERNDE